MLKSNNGNNDGKENIENDPAIHQINDLICHIILKVDHLALLKNPFDKSR